MDTEVQTSLIWSKCMKYREEERKWLKNFWAAKKESMFELLLLLRIMQGLLKKRGWPLTFKDDFFKRLFFLHIPFWKYFAGDGHIPNCLCF